LIANLLTAIRLLIILPTTAGIAGLLEMPSWLLSVLILIAIFTDYFDGKVARRLGTASPGGQVFDHTTDFLFVTSGLFGAAWAGLLTPVLPVLIIIAFSQYVLDSYFFYHEKRLHMSRLGRWNGVFYFIPLTLIAVGRLSPFGAFAGLIEAAIFVIGWILVLSTVLSILDRAMAPLHIGHGSK